MQDFREIGMLQVQHSRSNKGHICNRPVRFQQADNYLFVT